MLNITAIMKRPKKNFQPNILSLPELAFQKYLKSLFSRKIQLYSHLFLFSFSMSADLLKLYLHQLEPRTS